jgi:hypothetical protein
MPTIHSEQIFSYPQAENSHFVRLDVSDTPELSEFDQGVYGVLTVSTSEAGSTTGGNVIDNTAYQDTPFNAQVAVTTGAAVITANAEKGWITLTVGAGDTVYIGVSGVTTGNGYILNAANPTTTVSSDNLSEWYVIGAAGGETLYVIGAYVS